MREWIKCFIPKLFLLEIQKRKARRFEKRFMEELKADWQNVVGTIGQSASKPRYVQRVLIVPPDLGSPAGSLGDDAMISAAVESAKRYNPNMEIDLLAWAQESHGTISRNLPLAEIEKRSKFASAFFNLLERRRYDATLIVGADIMDGYYSPADAAMRIAAADLTARTGASAVFLGFSFNDRPAPELAEMFANLHSNVQINLRDPTSLGRFEGFSGTRGQLVADAAFCLKPGASDNVAEDWVNAQRNAGRKVIGFNLHPLLFKNATATHIAQIISRGSEALLNVTAERDASWLILPHDYRSGVGDEVCLRPIFDRVRDRLGNRVHYLEGKHSSAALKAVSGTLDGVFSARMHLAIASLGMGVPTSCVTYQGKFDGLYQHFTLPSDLLVSTAIFEEGDALEKLLLNFIDRLDSLKLVVEKNLPGVLEKSRRNFSVFGDHKLASS